MIEHSMPDSLANWPDLERAMKAYRITNEILGTVIIVKTLPPGVRVGVRDIGPSWNNRPPPKSIVEEIEAPADE